MWYNLIKYVLLREQKFGDKSSDSDWGKNVFTVDDKIKISDDGIRRDIMKKYDCEPKSIAFLRKPERNKILSELNDKYSIRQIERITGISRGVIANVQS